LGKALNGLCAPLAFDGLLHRAYLLQALQDRRVAGSDLQRGRQFLRRAIHISFHRHAFRPVQVLPQKARAKRVALPDDRHVKRSVACRLLVIPKRSDIIPRNFFPRCLLSKFLRSLGIGLHKRELGIALRIGD